MYIAYPKPAGAAWSVLLRKAASVRFADIDPQLWAGYAV